MIRLPTFGPIDFLVSRKFPRLRDIQKIAAHGNADSRDRAEKQLAEIEAYETKLKALPSEELTTLLNEEQKKEQAERREKAELEERQRFFNQPNAAADFAHWSKAAHWTLDEAIALSFGKAPEVVTWEIVQKYVNVSAFAVRYSRVRDLALRATVWKQLFDPVLPGFFLAWARRNEIEVPAELVERVEARGVVIADWKDLYDKTKEQFDKAMNMVRTLSATKEDLTARIVELESSLKSAWEGFDPKADAYPKELDIALQAWRAVSENRDSNKTVKEQVAAWVGQHYSDLSDEARQRISIVCNWEKEGGRKKRN